MTARAGVSGVRFLKVVFTSRAACRTQRRPPKVSPHPRGRTEFPTDSWSVSNAATFRIPVKEVYDGSARWRLAPPRPTADQEPALRKRPGPADETPARGSTQLRLLSPASG